MTPLSLCPKACFIIRKLFGRGEVFDSGHTCVHNLDGELAHCQENANTELVRPFFKSLT